MSALRSWSTVVALLLMSGGCRAGDCPAGSFRVENQCLQIEDTDCAEPVVLYRDVDEDGFGDPLDVTAGCSKIGFVDRGGDCDDTREGVHPGATEACNGRDVDCNGVVDDGCLIEVSRDDRTAAFYGTGALGLGTGGKFVALLRRRFGGRLV